MQADPPDLIFMDLGLPRMDGWEATRRIRELPGGKEVRIVALNARVDRRDYERAADVGCDDFIPKTVVKSEEVIGQALRAARRWRSTVGCPGYSLIARSARFPRRAPG